MQRVAVTSLVAVLAALPAVADEMRLLSWEADFGANSIARFETETGHTVVYDVFDSNEMVETRLLAGGSGYDVVTPNLSPHLARQLPFGIWAELDMARLPNAANMARLMGRMAFIHVADHPGVQRRLGVSVKLRIGRRFSASMTRRGPFAPGRGWGF